MTEKLSLTELQLIIRDSLYLALPEMYWIVAEISEIKENYAGHCYLELIEKHPDEKNVRSRAKAIIWNNRYRFLKSLFENITGESLREGLKVLVRTKVEYHELYGLSLIISDIDPSFTIGDMAVKRQQIIKKLEDEGVFTMNKELDFPILPQRIAVISSKNAAGYSDFMNHLKENSFGYVFYTALVETTMQGADTEQGIINALDSIAENSHLFDIVAIIRGGGAQSDLSWFDNYNIAFHITQFPLPVITGIGHDKDMSVTDLVANRALKTPTAVADFLIDSIAGAESEIIDLSTQIRDISRVIIERNRTRIESVRIRLSPLVMRMMSGKAMVVDTFRKRLITSTANTMNLNRIKTDGFNSTLKILNPENVLQRGYTITSLNGRIIKRSDQLTEGDLIDTKFSDGTVASIVKIKNGRKGFESSPPGRACPEWSEGG